MTAEELDRVNKIKSMKAPVNPKEVRRIIPVREESVSYKRTKMEILEDIDLSIDRKQLSEDQNGCVDNFVIYATLQDVKMKYKGLSQDDIDTFLKLEKDQDLVDSFTDEYPEYFA